ncbi:hypothetical protein [Kitasatospora sp. NPDC127116]|uniref:DUF6197 family protein n=1 Tax=Kitasatospora sp. NPDC127116 TaxID=3345367 RepID=UPI003633F4F0
MAAAATLEIDPDLYGPLLVREIEAYLAAIAPEPAWRARLRAAIAEAHTVPAKPNAGAVEPWWHTAPAPTQTLTGRLLRRRPVIRVTVRQHLQLMDRYITAHGWTQGQLWDETGAVCVLGAHVRVLAAGYGDASTTWRARLAIGNALGRLGHSLLVDTWNDLHSTTQDDVHRLLQSAAQRA